MAIFDAHTRDRLQVFIDGQNLFGTLRALEKKIDYKAFIETLRAETRFIRAQYFTTIRPQQDNEKFHSVLDFLDFNGYQLETKEVRDSMDGYGNIRSKGSMLVEMATQMLMAAMNGTDHIVLFSGDGELTAAVQACKLLDCRVTVVSSEQTRVISEDLRRVCDQYVDIESLPRNVIVDLNESFRPQQQHATAA
jgi:uncharacterized LabA/DUF88 family protein